MLTFLSESFRRMVFAHLHTLDHELVETEQPDVVIGLADESGLLDVPADVEAPRAGELAVRKLAAGVEPMPDLAPLWGQLVPEAATPSTASSLIDVEAKAATLAADVAARDEDKVVEGKDGWLFLATDTNHVIHQHTGRLRFSRRELEDWRHVLETRDRVAGARGDPVPFIVPPNTHAVYPEYLPDRRRDGRRAAGAATAAPPARERLGRHLIYPLDGAARAQAARPRVHQDRHALERAGRVHRLQAP